MQRQRCYVNIGTQLSCIYGYIFYVSRLKLNLQIKNRYRSILHILMPFTIGEQHRMYINFKAVHISAQLI